MEMLWDFSRRMICIRGNLECMGKGVSVFHHVFRVYRPQVARIRHCSLGGDQLLMHCVLFSVGCCVCHPGEINVGWVWISSSRMAAEWGGEKRVAMFRPHVKESVHDSGWRQPVVAALALVC